MVGRLTGWLKGMFKKEGVLWDVVAGAGGHLAAGFLEGEEGKKLLRQARVRMNPEAYVFTALLALEDEQLEKVLKLLEEVKEQEGTDDAIVRALATNLPLTESGEVDTEKAKAFLTDFAKKGPKQRAALLSVLQRDSRPLFWFKKVGSAAEAVALVGVMLTSCGYTLAADQLKEWYRELDTKAEADLPRVTQQAVEAEQAVRALFIEQRGRRTERRDSRPGQFRRILTIFVRCFVPQRS